MCCSSYDDPRQAIFELMLHTICIIGYKYGSAEIVRQHNSMIEDSESRQQRLLRWPAAPDSRVGQARH